MKLLIAGCSFATDLKIYFRDRLPGWEITTLASAAAGNKFIADSVVLATKQRRYDLVYVSWSGLSRYDVPVENIKLFDDWMARGRIHDQPYVFTGGIGSWDYHQHPFATELFLGYHKYVDHEQLYYNSLLEIIKTQGYLRSLNVDFCFATMINQFQADPGHFMEQTSEYGVTRYPTLAPLVKAIDFSDFVFGDNNKGIYETCRDLGMISEDNFHPSAAGYAYWVDQVIKQLTIREHL